MPEVREERRVVTALFADVVGSTALAEKHDPEEARLIVGEAIKRAVRIVESYGGTVKDLAGDGLLALFGAPTAHEDDPVRALRAGLAIAADVADYAEEVRRGWGVEGFGVRLGAETGEVVVGEVGAGSRTEYGATGDAVNVAARLQAAATPGSVLAGPRTRRLAELQFDWGDPQPLQLKGKTEPVAASPVLRPRSAPDAEAPTLAPLVGREREVASVTEAISALVAGRGGIVFVSGEPGIGKSRLTAEARRIALSTGAATWLEGRAVSYGASLAWWPVRDFLRGWIGVGTQEPELRVRLALKRRLEEVLRARAADLQPYLGVVLGLAAEGDGGPALMGLSPEALQYQTYEVLVEVVEALAAQGPLALAVDDLHWADATSVGFYDRLLGLTETLPLLLFFNHRPETAHASWSLREKAIRDFRHLVTVLELQPLDVDAEQQLLRALAEGALSSEAEARVIAFADGNPLYLEELARSLGEGGTEREDALPETLEGVILARLDRLEPAWRDVLTAASACGRSFSIGLLEAVTGIPELELRQGLHNLLRLDLLNEERRWPDASYRFKHALIQEAAYRTLVRSRRQELHARAAAWLEERYADSPERVYGLLAHHNLEAQAGERAAHYLRLAGEQALGEWALDEAARHFRDLARVLREQGREAEAARPLFQLAHTLHLAMRFPEADEAWAQAAELWEPPASGPETPRSTMIVGGPRLPWDADTFHGYYAANLRLTVQLEDSLFVTRPGPSVEPLLARRLEVSDDGLRYIVHLHSGLTSHSGRAFDSEAVVAGLREFLRRSNDASIFWSVAGSQLYSETGDDSDLGIRALGPLAVELRLTRRTPYLPQLLTYPQFGGALPDDRTGAYRLVELSETAVEIEAEPGYRLPRPGNVGRVRWQSIRPEEAEAALRTGAVDVMVEGHHRNWPDAGAARQVAGPYAFLLGLMPVWNGLPVDAHLRRALALATDRERLRPLLADHHLPATGGTVPPSLPGHTPGIAPAFDPDGARRALAESSHRGPLRAAYYVEVVHPTIQETFQCWRDVLGLDVQAVPISIRDNATAGARVHVLQMNWVAAVADPAYFLAELFHSTSRSNLFRVADPALDALLESAEAAPDGGARLALYHEADRLVVAGHHLAIPILYARMAQLVQPWVRGWWEWANSSQRYCELTITPDSPRYSG